MSAERITVDAVEAAVVEFDAQERAVLGRQVVMSLGLTGMVVAQLAPREWEEVAAHLAALIDHSPLRDGKAYVAHRALYGALVADLRSYARVAGEPTGLEADLRGAGSKAEERRIRERMADQQAARDRELDDAEHQTGIDHDQTLEDIERVDALMDAATRRALAQEDERIGPEPEEEPAAPTTERSDAEYLL